METKFSLHELELLTRDHDKLSDEEVKIVNRCISSGRVRDLMQNLDSDRGFTISGTSMTSALIER